MQEKKPRKKRKDPRIEQEYFEDIEVTNPKTGEKIIQRVKITRYKYTGGPIEPGNKGISQDLDLEDSDLDDGLINID